MQEGLTNEEFLEQAHEADHRWLVEAGTMYGFMIDATKALEAIVDAHKAPIWYDWNGEDAWMPNFDIFTVLNGFHAWIRHYIALLPTEAEAQYLSGLTNDEWRNSVIVDGD